MSFPVKAFWRLFEASEERAARWGYEQAQADCDERLKLAVDNALRVGMENTQEKCDVAFRDGFKNGGAEGLANGKVIGYDLAVRELTAQNAGVKRRVRALPAWKQGFEAAQSEFERLLREERNRVEELLSRQYTDFACGQKELLLSLLECLKNGGGEREEAGRK